jgi:hypothetical protein
MDKELTYPLQISVNMLVVTPNSKPKTAESEPTQNSKITKPSTPSLGGGQENDDDDDYVADPPPTPNRSNHSNLNCGSSSCSDGGILQ